ncbi:ABC transporter permease [Kineococcus xinjiangensis]|uniref:ABC transporter permease n=1 Tax=Kineococcus xinjiangensis TaxID=512762 RepID=UPI001305021E|nr:ABC transporter permease [Kineococcus xinjiangensis]
MVWRNLLAHKVRLALSGLAVVLGVAFVAGTLVFTDTLERTFTALFESTTADVDVSAERAFEPTGAPGGAPPQPLDAALAGQIAAVDGVASATGYVQSPGVYVIGPDGKVVATGGAPGIGTGWDPAEGLGMTLTAGRAPAARDEVVLDEATAERTGYGIGDTVELLTPGPRLSATVVGTLRFGESGGLAGASLVAFDTATAQELLAAPGTFHGVSVQAADGVGREELAERVDAALGEGLAVATREEASEKRTEQLAESLGFIDVFLLVFAGIALFVGSFIILNTFSMLVAQRTRELALLRALGASRRQVTGSVLAEALVLAVLGSTAGLLLGLAVAAGLRWAFGRVGLTLDGSLVVAPRTVVAAYAVGVLVTVLAAYLPARRAAKVPPVAALRDDHAMPDGSLRRRTRAGAVLGVAGGTALVAGTALDDAPATLVLLGSLALVVAAIALSPVLARPFLRVAGAALPRIWGPAGRLARENALRNPRRTAATASALMVGVALVTGFSIIGQSANASIGSAVAERMRSDFIVSSAVTQPFSPQVAEEVRGLDGVASVGVARLGFVELDGEPTMLFGVDETTGDDVFALDVIAGQGGAPADGQLLVDADLARDRGWEVGETVAVRGVNGEQRELELRGIYETAPSVGPALLPLATLGELGGEPLDRWVFVQLAEGAGAGAVREAVEAVVADHPIVSVKDMGEFVQEQQGQVAQLLMIINAMLVLSVLIAVLGIVNTLALSVLERTREVGLLRAVGMARRQLRRTIRLEAVLIALFGAVLGLGLGLVFGVGLVSVLDGQGIDELAVPGGRLAVLLAVSALVGVLAAAWPAHRASRMPVLRALATAQ